MSNADTGRIEISLSDVYGEVRHIAHVMAELTAEMKMAREREAAAREREAVAAERVKEFEERMKAVERKVWSLPSIATVFGVVGSIGTLVTFFKSVK